MVLDGFSKGFHFLVSLRLQADMSKSAVLKRPPKVVQNLIRIMCYEHFLGFGSIFGFRESFWTKGCTFWFQIANFVRGLHFLGRSGMVLDGF